MYRALLVFAILFAPIHVWAQDLPPSEAQLASDRDAFAAVLAERRRSHLAELRRYVETGVFPANVYRPGLLNVFRDEEGHLCAVANLIAFDGEQALIEQAVLANNFVRLADVHDGPLLQWILGSGFTQEEIALIQAPYVGTSFEESQRDPFGRQRALSLRLEREKARLQRILGRVIRRLERNEARSLRVAVDRASAGVV